MSINELTGKKIKWYGEFYYKGLMIHYNVGGNKYRLFSFHDRNSDIHNTGYANLKDLKRAIQGYLYKK